MWTTESDNDRVSRLNLPNLGYCSIVCPDYSNKWELNWGNLEGDTRIIGDYGEDIQVIQGRAETIIRITLTGLVSILANRKPDRIRVELYQDGLNLFTTTMPDVEDAERFAEIALDTKMADSYIIYNGMEVHCWDGKQYPGPLVD